MVEKIERLRILWQLDQGDHIDLFFADEAGCQLIPNIPYGWQAKGEYVRMLPRKGKTLRIFGLLRTDDRLISYPTEDRTNADFIIQSLDRFVQKIDKPTVMVLDNAPIHRATKMKAKIVQWQQQGLFIFFLPKYAPHLNRIETLWRKMKYEWLHHKDYKSWTTLTKAVKNILATFGSDRFNIQLANLIIKFNFKNYLSQTNAS